MTVYKYKVERTSRRLPLNRLKTETADEGFTGLVHGIDASDLEERYARGLDRRHLRFEFQWEATVATTVPGQEKKIDFIVWAGVPYPVEIDSEFVHKSAEKRREDEDRDDLINEALAPYGYMPVRRLPEEEVATPEIVDFTIRKQFG